MNRLDERFQAWVCADCDPTDEEPGDVEWDKPYVLLLPVGERPPDHCPRCSSYLGFCEGDGDLVITNTLAERYAARHKR